MVRVEFSTRHLLLLVGALLLAWVVYLVRGTVVLLGIAVMLMATLHPLVQLAKRRGLSHSQAVALVMLALVAALTPLIISEVQDFAQHVPALQQRLDSLLRHAGVAAHVNATIAKANLPDRLGSLAGEMAAPTMAFFADVVEVVVVAGYLLADSRRLRFLLHEFLPHRSERHIEPLLAGMERVVGGYIRGQCITSGMYGLFVMLLCLGLGVSYPLLLGIIAAVGDVIPLFGVQAAMAVIALVAFMQSTWQMVAVVVGCVVYGQLESHIFVPRIYARTVCV